MKFETTKNHHGDLAVLVHDVDLDMLHYLIECLGYKQIDMTSVKPLPTFIKASSHYYLHPQYGIASFDGQMIEAVERNNQVYLQTLVDEQIPYDITIHAGPDMPIYPGSWSKQISYEDLVNDTYY